MTDEFKAYWLRDHFDLKTSAASIAWLAWQEGRVDMESRLQMLMSKLADLLDEDQFAACENIARAAGVEPPDGLRSAATAVAIFIGGAKDRLGRPDPCASEEMRNARARVLELATHYGVQGGHATYLDQCAAVLRAAIAKATGSAA